MSTWKKIAAVTVTIGLLNGCAVIVQPEPPVTGEYGERDDYYIDSYISIPYEIRALIAASVDGYSTPPVDRYGPEIYPDNSIWNTENLPSYIRADFNGDGYSDYAYMFSNVSWSRGAWFLRTKLLVVVSTEYGYVLSSEYVLGTVTAADDIPVEEYWGIRLLRRGTHTVSVYKNGYYEKVSVELDCNGIYLGSIEPHERSVLYITNTELHEMMLDLGSIPKKRIISSEERANRIITLQK